MRALQKGLEEMDNYFTVRTDSSPLGFLQSNKFCFNNKLEKVSSLLIHRQYS